MGLTRPDKRKLAQLLSRPEAGLEGISQLSLSISAARHTNIVECLCDHRRGARGKFLTESAPKPTPSGDCII